MKCFVAFFALLAVAIAEPGVPGLLARGAVNAGYGAVAAGYGGHGLPVGGYAAPSYVTPAVAVAAAPNGYGAPLAAAPRITSNQYRKQDELGNYEFGYNNLNSQRREQGNGYGGVTGSYSYVDANGLDQRVDYIADDYGFRVTGSNIPNPAAASAVNLGYATGGYGGALGGLGLARHKRSYGAAYGTGLPAPVGAQRVADYGIFSSHGIGIGIGHGYGGYGNGQRVATLQIEKLNPGHATAYRVY